MPVTGKMCRALEQEGYALQDLLQGTGATREEVYSLQPDATPWESFKILAQNAIRLTGNPALGLWVGRRINLSSLGAAGLAGMSSANMLESALMFAKYAALYVGHIRPEVEFVLGPDGQGLTPCLRIDEVRDHDGIRPFLMETAMRFIADAALTLAGAELQGLRFEVNYLEPPYWESVDFEYPVRFGMDAHRVFADNISARLVNSDRATMRALQALLDLQLKRKAEEEDIIERTRGALSRSYRARVTDLPNAEEMARSLGMSPRAFRKALHDADTNYRELLDAFRRAAAEQALTTTDLSVSAIARRLGYHDPANFRRAFRRWTGSSPKAFREEATGG